MRHCVQVIYVLTLAAMASAHFQLLFPSPRGPFVDVNEPNFCDGYNNPAANRTQFPLSSGFFSLNSEHPQWTVGVLVSSAANATSFNNFSQVKPFFQQQGEGAFCFPLNFSANANGTSLQDGQNVTIQIMFNGGDGNLFQCADLTLSSSVQISSSVSCSNATSSTSTASGASTPSPTGKSSGTVEKAKSVAELAAMLGACWIAFLVL